MSPSRRRLGAAAMRSARCSTRCGSVPPREPRGPPPAPSVAPARGANALVGAPPPPRAEPAASGSSRLTWIKQSSGPALAPGGPTSPPSTFLPGSGGATPSPCASTPSLGTPTPPPCVPAPSLGTPAPPPSASPPRLGTPTPPPPSHPPTVCVRPHLERTHKFDPINRVNNTRIAANLPRLIALQLPNKMPAKVKQRQFLRLRTRLLVTALTDLTHPQFRQFGNKRCRVKLCHNDRRDRCRVTFCAPRGIHDLAPHRREPLGEIGHFRKSGISRSSSSSSKPGSATMR